MFVHLNQEGVLYAHTGSPIIMKLQITRTLSDYEILYSRNLAQHTSLQSEQIKRVLGQLVQCTSIIGNVVMQVKPVLFLSFHSCVSCQCLNCHGLIGHEYSDHTYYGRE